MPDDANSANPARKRAPTLYVIIAMKLLKGLTFATLAMTAYVYSDNDLPKDYAHVLQQLHHWMHLNPERRFWVELSNRVDNLTEVGMVRAAIGTLIYSMFSLVEGVGLMFRIKWAGWLSIGESAFFIPIEVSELMHRFTVVVFVIMVVNIFMLWYLYQNRERLFRHAE